MTIELLQFTSSYCDHNETSKGVIREQGAGRIKEIYKGAGSSKTAKWSREYGQKQKGSREHPFGSLQNR